MKIKSVAQICKKSKSVYLFDDDSGEHLSQWVGDGYAMYPISGLPELDEESVFTIFDIPKKDRDKMYFEHCSLPTHISFEDNIDGEYQIEKGNLFITAAGRTLMPLPVNYFVEFIDTRYLAPLSNVLDTVEFYARKSTAGNTYIAVKTGFLLAAIIKPYDIMSEEFVKKLDELKKQTVYSLQIKESRKREAAAAEPKQFTMNVTLGNGADISVNPETGEINQEDDEDGAGEA